MNPFSFTQFPAVSTERLALRELSFNDKKAIFRLRTNKEINKLIVRESLNNLNSAEAFIDVCHQEFAKENRIFWAIELKKTGQLIGTIVFHKIDLENGYAEIGYELDPDYHEEGLMTEAMQAILKFGIETMKLQIIEAFTHKNNTASIALLEKHLFVLQPERKDECVENNRIFQLEITK